MWPVFIINSQFLASQVDDLDGDGEWDEAAVLADFTANEKKVVTIELVEKDKYPEFEKRTNLRLGIEQEDGSYKEVDYYKSLPCTTEFKIIAQGESISWENDKIAFRVYFDCRNVKDLFGKLKADMIIDKIHTPAIQDYHVLNNWGMDILHCGSSLGSGGIALLKNDSLYRPGSTNVYEYHKITEGPVRSVFDLIYKGWHVDGDELEATERVSIYSGKYWFQSDVNVNGLPEGAQIVTGIVTSMLKRDSFAFEADGFQVIGTLTDISVPKKYQLTLLNSLNREKELNELKTRFVSMTSHELRTPLSTMLLKTDALEAYWEKMSLTDRVQKIHQIRGNVKLLGDIVEKVLNLSHLDSGKMKYQPAITNINELLLSIVEDYLDRPGVKHSITYTGINEHTDLMLDKQMITQAFNNLLDNAVKYSNPGTIISLRSYDDRNRLNITITDQGIGISEQDAKTIWEPFIRGSNVDNIPGTGLGLALTKQIVQIHGGDLKLKSKLNEGTAFTVSLPIGQCL